MPTQLVSLTDKGINYIDISIQNPHFFNMRGIFQVKMLKNNNDILHFYFTFVRILRLLGVKA